MSGWPIRDGGYEADPDEINPGEVRPRAEGSVKLANGLEAVFHEGKTEMDLLYPPVEFENERGETVRRQGKVTKQIGGGFRRFMAGVVEGDGEAVRAAEREAAKRYAEVLDMKADALHSRPLRVSTTGSMATSERLCEGCRQPTAAAFQDANGRLLCGTCSGNDDLVKVVG